MNWKSFWNVELFVKEENYMKKKKRTGLKYINQEFVTSLYRIHQISL